MFSHLVESDLHKGELKRRGTFFLATMIAYAAVLLATGVVGVYAYEAQMEDQNLELVALVPPDTEEVKPKEAEVRPKSNPQNSQPSGGSPRPAGGLIKNTPTDDVSKDLTKVTNEIKGSTTQTPPIFSTGERRLNPDDITAILGGPGNKKANQSNPKGGDGDDILGNEKPPEMNKKTEAPPQKERIPYVGPVTGRAISLPQPLYPQLAKTAGVQGPVTVELVIDEAGRVLSARATGGHPLLKPEAEKAAYRARFSPTLLQNQPIKVKGVITFNFVLNK